MLDYVPAEEKPEFRIPVWIFAGLLVIAIGVILWGNSGDLVDSIVRPDFLISEIQPANWTTLADSDGEFPDWIEIHNASAGAVNLEGWHLSDDAAILHNGHSLAYCSSPINIFSSSLPERIAKSIPVVSTPTSS